MTPREGTTVVTQADREAAANYMAFVSVLKGEYDPVSMAFMDELCDDMPIVQTLAAHRTSSTAELLEALLAVVAATRAYLPPDGIDAQECINRILAATENPRINPIIREME